MILSHCDSSPAESNDGTNLLEFIFKITVKNLLTASKLVDLFALETFN